MVDFSAKAGHYKMLSEQALPAQMWREWKVSDVYMTTSADMSDSSQPHPSNTNRGEASLKQSDLVPTTYSVS